MWFLPLRTGPCATPARRGPHDAVAASPPPCERGTATPRSTSSQYYQCESLGDTSRRALLAALSLGLAAGPGAAAVLDSQTDLLRRQYDSYADTYDDLDGGFAADALGLSELRSQLLAKASGDVLEVGVGTGLNLRFYEPAQITSLTALDLSEGMLAAAERRAASLGLPTPGMALAFRTGDAQSLPFPPASFDCVVDTFSLCVFPDPLAALRSMTRVLRPSGRLLLLEHSRSGLAPLGWYQDLTAPAVAAMGKGCAWNQDVLGLLRSAGLRVVSTREHMGGLLVWVVAERAA